MVLSNSTGIHCKTESRLVVLDWNEVGLTATIITWDKGNGTAIMSIELLATRDIRQLGLPLAEKASRIQ